MTRVEPGQAGAGGDQPDLFIGCEGYQFKELSIRERVMVVAQHSVHVDTGKHVFQHGDGVGGDPEEPDLALGLELLERAYAVA